MGSVQPPVDRDAELARRFVVLADTLVDDFDVFDLLDQLVHTCVELLAISTAALLITDADGVLHPVAASTETTHMLELFQVQNEEGPCLDCVRSGEVVQVDDVRTAIRRWPRFGDAMRRAGFDSVLALPMRLRHEAIGSLNLFNAPGVHHLSAGERQIAQALADVATIGILQQRSLRRSTLLAEELQRALDTRVVIEQAKGVLAQYGAIDVRAGFLALRDYARSNHLTLGHAATALVNGDLSPSSFIGRNA